MFHRDLLLQLSPKKFSEHGSKWFQICLCSVVEPEINISRIIRPKQFQVIIQAAVGLLGIINTSGDSNAIPSKMKVSARP